MNTKIEYSFLLCGAILFGGMVAGCHHTYPDAKGAVQDTLKAHSLDKVDVSQDRDKGVMTLKGNLASESDRQEAENLSRQAAPGYTIADEIGVRPPDANNAGAVASNRDSAIEDNFKASIKARRNLDDQSIHASSKNGTIVITGSVKTTAQKTEVGTLAKHVPNVQQVVNELEVKPNKHSTPNS